VSGSVGRNIAFHRARRDQDGVNGILNTALAVLCGVAVLALAATFGILLLFLQLFEVPPDQLDAVRLSVLIIGLNLALSFPLSVFDGVLWAFQRFDVQNAIDIPVVLLRAGLTYYFIGTGHGLLALALVTLLTSALGGAIKALISLRLEAGLRVGLAHVNRHAAGSLYGYGIWYFMLSLVRTISPRSAQRSSVHA